MEQYTISDKVKRFVFILIGIGVLAMAADIIISLVSGGGAEHAEHAEGGHGHQIGRASCRERV